MRSLIIDRILHEGWRSSDWIHSSSIVSLFFRGTQALCKYHHKDLYEVAQQRGLLFWQDEELLLRDVP